MTKLFLGWNTQHRHDRSRFISSYVWKWFDDNHSSPTPIILSSEEKDSEKAKKKLRKPRKKASKTKNAKVEPENQPGQFFHPDLDSSGNLPSRNTSKTRHQSVSSEASSECLSFEVELPRSSWVSWLLPLHPRVLSLMLIHFPCDIGGNIRLAGNGSWENLS